MTDFSKARNAGKLKEIQEKSAEQANGLVAINIPLDQIDENPDNANIFNMEGIDILAEGIKEDGFNGAISVFKKPDGRYEISSGHRRYRAMLLNGEDTIPCIVSPYPEDETERGLKLVSSNIRNRNMLPMDWARVINYYMEIMKKKGEYEGRLRDRAAEYFQMAQTNIHRYTSLLKLIPELQELANDPEYAFSAFTSAATLSEVEQKELYNRIIRENNMLDNKNGNAKVLSRARIEQLINDLKHKDDVFLGQQNKADGNYNVASLSSGSESSVANTVNHMEQIEEGSSGSEKVSGVVDFDGSMNTPVDTSDDTIDESEYEPSDEEYGETESGAVEHEVKEPVKASSSPSPSSSTSGAPILDNRLTKFANDIESLSRSDFEVADSAQVKILLERITAAVKNIELSI